MSTVALSANDPRVGKAVGRLIQLAAGNPEAFAMIESIITAQADGLEAASLSASQREVLLRMGRDPIKYVQRRAAELAARR